MSRKKVMVIGSSWEQEELIKELKRTGAFIIATHPVMDEVGYSLADVFAIKDSRDIDGHRKLARPIP